MSRFKNAQEIHAENGICDMRLENMKIEELFTAHMSEAHPEKQMPEPREDAEKQECFTYDDMRHAFARGWHASKHVRDDGMRAAMQSSASSERAAMDTPKWTALSDETLPPDGHDVLVYTATGLVKDESPMQVRSLWRARESGEACYYTHWMPTPKAPSGERPRGD